MGAKYFSHTHEKKRKNERKKERKKKYIKERKAKS